LLLATALSENATLLSADANFNLYNEILEAFPVIAEPYFTLQ
jgi:hypothetical protein